MPTGRQAQIILNVTPNVAGWNAFVVKATADMQKIAAIAGGIGGIVGPGPPGKRPPAAVAPGGGTFMLGWQRAGGFPAALATILKFGLAYKVGIDIPLKIINTTLDGVKMALVEGGAAWMDYQEQMASAARTMEQPGFTRPFLTEVMGRDALNFLKDYRVTMEQVAQAQYELGSAGFTAQQTLQTYTVPLKLAIGLHGDITQTTRILTQMLKIHGEQMGDNMTEYEKMMRIAGIVAKTWQIEQFELSDLAASYKYVAGSATALRLPMEQLIPLLGFLSTYGLRGSLAGTALNQMIVQLARNVQLTNGQIDSLIKKSRGMEHVITLKPGAHTVFDVMQQMAVALQKKGVTPEERLKAVGVAMDMLNIRGGRPVALMMARLTEYLSKVGDAAKMTTADCEGFVDMLVRLAQATVPAQLDIAANKLQVMGIRFFQAAIGADTAVSALERLNKKLDTFIDKAEDAGDVAYIMFRQVVGAVKGAWEEIRQPTRWRLPILPGLLGGILGAKRGEEEGRWEVTENAMRRQMADQAGELLKSGMATKQVRGRIESTLLEFTLERAAKGVTTPRIDIDEIIKKVREEETARKMGLPPLPGLPEYKGTPTGGAGGAGARAETAQETADRAARDQMETWREEMKYRQFKHPDETRAARDKYISQLDEIGLKEGKWAAISIRTANQVYEEQRGLRQDNINEENAAADNRVALAQTVHDRAILPYMLSLEELQDRLAAVTQAENLYGQSAITTAQKLSILSDMQMQGSAASERAEARLLELLRQEPELLREAQELEKEPGTPEQIRKTAEYATWQRDVAQARSALRQLGDTAKGVNQGMIEGTRAMRSDVVGAFEDMQTGAETARLRYEALGGDWETSTERLRALDEEIEWHNSLLSESADQLREKLISEQEYADEVEKHGLAQRRLRIEAEAVTKVQRPQLLQDWRLRMRQVVAGWAPTTGRAGAEGQVQAGLDRAMVEVGRMRQQYGKDWAETDLALYQKVFDADAILQPWKDARDRIEREWTDMFTDVFTRMAAGEKDALWAGLGSIIQSLQGQMIAQWTKRHLGGLFEVFAQQEVGPTVGPAGLAAKGLNLAELRAEVLSRSLTMLDERTTTAATALSGLNTEATTITGTFSALNAVLAQTIATVGGQQTEGGGILGFGASVPLRLPGVATAAVMSKAVEKGVQKGIEQAAKQPVTAPAPTTKATRPSATTLAGFMGNYAAGSMFAGMAGGAMGYEPGSAAVAGGLGYAAGMALGFGPWGAAALGLASIFGFGKKKKKAQEEVSPQRDIYGMPAFEWESYLYNLYKNEKALSAYALGSVYDTRLSEAGAQVTVDQRSVGSITININGGDTAEVRRVLDSTLGRLFGSVARANAGVRASSG